MHRLEEPLPSYLVTPADEAARRLLERYLRRRRTDVERIPQLLANRDFEQLRRLGHNWFGSGTAYEFPPISVLGERLEQAAERGDAAAAAGIRGDMADFLASVAVSPPAS